MPSVPTIKPQAICVSSANSHCTGVSGKRSMRAAICPALVSLCMILPPLPTSRQASGVRHMPWAEGGKHRSDAQ
jgi:hypothetical protein